MSSTVTIHQLAKQLGVSPMTVSYALRGTGRIGQNTRERVLQTAQELGYRPNSSARATRTGRFGCIGLLISNDRNFSYMPDALLWGIESAVEDANSHLTLARLPVENFSPATPLPKFLREGMVDGLLVNYTHGVPAGLLESMAQTRIPSIWMNCKQTSDCVYPDDRGASRKLTEQLLAEGHRRIAFVIYESGFKDAQRDHYSATDRYSGYSDAMRSAGLPPLVVQTPDRMPGSEWLAYSLTWMKKEDRPTAVVAYRSSSARPVQMAAALCGLDMKQFRVVTFTEWANEDVNMGISSLHIPFNEMGRNAVEMLLQKMKTPAAPLPPRAIEYKFDLPVI
jgi:LacI family transcriptional regulator